MARSADDFRMQRSVRRPWRRYIDELTAHRPALHAYCCQLTGNVWDGKDLVQDTLVRVFSLLGRTDTTLENAKAYLIRTAANLWIDRMRRSRIAIGCSDHSEGRLLQASAAQPLTPSFLQV
jgi:DNA-directed RNA polymerase specialized sigma24 family protein